MEVPMRFLQASPFSWDEAVLRIVSPTRRRRNGTQAGGDHPLILHASVHPFGGQGWDFRAPGAHLVISKCAKLPCIAVALGEKRRRGSRMRERTRRIVHEASHVHDSLIDLTKSNQIENIRFWLRTGQIACLQQSITQAVDMR